MNNEAWNKIIQTHEVFSKITAPLKHHLGLSFGYMKVFIEGSYYYRVMDNLDCNKNLIAQIEKGRIFSEHNITNYFDHDYRFTLWPDLPKHKAMEICHQCDVWNGITISKINEHSIDLYWFNSIEKREDWQKFFIRNKALLLKFINYFDQHKKDLYICDSLKKQELFQFKQGFDINIPEPKYIKDEFHIIKDFINALSVTQASKDMSKPALGLSPREIEVLSIIGRGYAAKVAAQKLDISTKTIYYHIDSIKRKTKLHFKSDILKFYEECCNDFIR